VTNKDWKYKAFGVQPGPPIEECPHPIQCFECGRQLYVSARVLRQATDPDNSNPVAILCDTGMFDGEGDDDPVSCFEKK